MTLQVGDDDVADRDQRRVAAGKRLDRHLAAAQKNQLDVETVFAKNSIILGDPELRLTRTDRRIADANFVRRLRAGRGSEQALHQRG